MNQLHEVVVTGMGAITPRGDWTLNASAPKASTSTETDAKAVSDDGGAIANFVLGDYLDSQKTYLDRCSALALAGCALALRDADLLSLEARRMSTHAATQDGIGDGSRSASDASDETASDDSDEAAGGDSDETAGGDFGITLGTHLGCLETMKGFWDKVASGGVRSASPLLFSHSYFNSPISLCAIEFGLKGFHGTFCHRSQSGYDAVRAAFDAIRLGHARAMLCGGVEALTPARALFEPGENNAQLGEASVFLVLEESESATRRGVRGRPFDDVLLQAARAREEAVAALAGDCGGASGALWIARHIKDDGVKGDGATLNR